MDEKNAKFKHARGKIFLLVIGIVWGVICVMNFLPVDKDFSVSERRRLTKMPQATVKTVLNGKFMSDFESAALDQFPLRDEFRSVKAFSVFYLFGQKDNNDIYIVDDYASKIDYPTNLSSIDHFINVLEGVYEKNIAGTDCQVYFSMVPDKNYYMAAANGYPVCDYYFMKDYLAKKLDFASNIDITGLLSKEDYYRTDTHWRQECIQKVAGRLLSEMNVTGGNDSSMINNSNMIEGSDMTENSGSGSMSSYILNRVDVPFYGVLYGQAALPMEPDTIYYLSDEIIDKCTVYNYETGKTTGVYDLSELSGYDPYEMFLSGATPLLEITNPSASTDKELVVFRDSFGSSLVPLMVKNYSKVTLVDLRYMNSKLIPEYVNFTSQDVLFLYSTLVINSSQTLK